MEPAGPRIAANDRIPDRGGQRRAVRRHGERIRPDVEAIGGRSVGLRGRRRGGRGGLGLRDVDRKLVDDHARDQLAGARVDVVQFDGPDRRASSRSDDVHRAIVCAQHRGHGEPEVHLWYRDNAFERRHLPLEGHPPRGVGAFESKDDGRGHRIANGDPGGSRTRTPPHCPRSGGAGPPRDEPAWSARRSRDRESAGHWHTRGGVRWGCDRRRSRRPAAAASAAAAWAWAGGWMERRAETVRARLPRRSWPGGQCRRRCPGRCQRR